jgi:dynein heavy chain
MEWFAGLIDEAAARAEQNPNLEKRGIAVQEQILELLYARVSRSLFQRHKLLFAFLLAITLAKPDDREFAFLLRGAIEQTEIPVNPCVWVPDTAWPEVFLSFFGLSQLPAFQGLLI